MITEAEYVTVQTSLNEMLCAVCDHAHDRCVKVIVARAKVMDFFFCFYAPTMKLLGHIMLLFSILLFIIAAMDAHIQLKFNI